MKLKYVLNDLVRDNEKFLKSHYYELQTSDSKWTHRPSVPSSPTISVFPCQKTSGPFSL